MRDVAEVLVEVVGTHGLIVAGDLVDAPRVGVCTEPVRIADGHLGPRRTGRGNQQERELVADQRVGLGGLGSARGGHAQSGGTHTLGDAPAIAGGTDGRGFAHIGHQLDSLAKFLPRPDRLWGTSRVSREVARACSPSAFRTCRRLLRAPPSGPHSPRRSPFPTSPPRASPRWPGYRYPSSTHRVRWRH